MSRIPLVEVIAAVEAEGAALRAEFYLPSGPRGARGSCPIDSEIEERLKHKLQALVPATFAGEETTPSAGTLAGWVWLVDPQDGTFEFSSGRRGSAISVALLREGVPVLGVVHAPDSPDRGPDTVAWAEGHALFRNEKRIQNDLSRQHLAPGAIVFATASAALRPETWSLAVSPARYVALPSIAYRLARVAAGDGVATLSVHGLSEYDVAGGMALIRAAGGVVVDAEARSVTLEGKAERRLNGFFAGAPDAVRRLAAFDWRALDQEPPRKPRVSLGFPRPDAKVRLSRAQGCLLGQVIGDSLGSLVELKPAAEIALTLARTLLRQGHYDAEKVLDAYREWLTSRPVDVGMTTERGLIGKIDTTSESNGSLMRASPIGIHAAGDPALAALIAREDSALTHPNEVCREACAAYCAAIAAGIAGASPREMVQAALEHSKGAARDAIAAAKRPADFFTRQGWVLTALGNAFYALLNLGFEEALIQTIGQGGDTDTNAAICGALLGAAHGREAIPSRWILPVLACRPLAECGALRPRPIDYWPDDVLELAEALLWMRS